MGPRPFPGDDAVGWLTPSRTAEWEDHETRLKGTHPCVLQLTEGRAFAAREITEMSGSVRFAWQPVLEGRRVRLRPFGEDDLDQLWEMLCDEEGRRLTGTHATFTSEVADRWYRSRGRETDRLDLAIADRRTDRCVGEEVLNDLNPRARHVYEKLGFVVEGVFRDALWWEDRFHDAIAMAMLAPEWARQVGLPTTTGTDRPTPSRS